MASQLNIKAEEAYTLATQLASLRGESLTGAVTHALRQALEREQQGLDEEAVIAAIKGIAAEIRRHMQHPLPASDHAWLYDENGLPA